MSNKSKAVPILMGCGILFIVMIVSCAGLMFYFYRTTDANVSPRIDELFTAVQNDKFGDTYLTDITPEFRSVATQEQYEQIGAAIRTRLGALKSKTMTSFSVRQFNTSTYTDVVYNAAFEKGPGTITARLQNINGKWLFASFRVNSPLFQQDTVVAKCPQCGEPHTASAKFCPACGAPLVKAEKEDEDAVKQPAEASVESP